MGNLFQEIKRRKVFRVAAIYAVVAWVLIQVADTIAPLMNLPEPAPRLVLFLLIILFPIALFLAWAYEVTPDGIKADTGIQPRQNIHQSTSLHPINYIILVLVLLAVGFQIADRFFSDSGSGEIARANSSLPGQASQIMRANLVLGDAIADGEGKLGSFSISPNGQLLARINHLRDEGASAIIQDLTTDTSRVLPDTSTGRYPALSVFSPSGERVVFINDNFNPGLLRYELFTVALNGGGSQLVTNPGGSVAWFTEQSLIYRPAGQGDLHTIGWNGGASEALGIPIEAGKRPSWPSRIFDTPWVIYTKSIVSGSVVVGDIEVFNIETKEAKVLISRGYNARYAASGHLVFMRDGDLWAAPIDKDRMELIGNEIMIEQGIAHMTMGGRADYAFSNNGRLLYRRGLDAAILQGNGVEFSEVGGASMPHAIPLDAVQGRFSPTGDSIVFTVGSTLPSNADSNIAVYNIAEQIMTRRTFSGKADRPLWTPDGRQIIYRQRDVNTDTYGLWRINADGSGEPEQLLSAPVSLSPTSFSPDGTQLVFSQGLGVTSEVKVLSLQNVETPIQNLFPSNSPQQDTAEISPDGRWIVYGSDEAGGRRIFVRPFPNVDDGKWLVSDIRAREAHWAGNGQLYFLEDGAGSSDFIYRVSVDTQSGAPAFGKAELMFRSLHRNAFEPNFNLSPDGQQILYARSPADTEFEADNLVLVENWFTRLRELAPPDQN